eukprot:TRINITY_DN4905_c0_g1_i1.p1 TRINITY_DN4905_c0_g1~~TRINITY_DN4905_c0_g1_i1.p1  ORF type:complete len:375 (-),score=37.61 TRINITY_DN4905_c0_g1_i1:311-1435(-)
MAEISATVKRAHFHVDDLDRSESSMSSSRQRTSAALSGRILEARSHAQNAGLTENEGDDARRSSDEGFEEPSLLVPRDEDDSVSVHAHPGPSPLAVDAEGMLDSSESEMDTTHREESETRLAGASTESWNTLRDETHDYSEPAIVRHASFRHQNDYGNQRLNGEHSQDVYRSSLTNVVLVPNEIDGDNLSASLHALSDAPVNRHEPERWQSSQGEPELSVQSHHGDEPARSHFIANFEEQQAGQIRTTVMLIDVPLHYTSSMLIHTIDLEGFAGKYNFVYVPMDFGSRLPSGYAFVNLLDASTARRFLEAFDGFSRWMIKSKNVCRALWARKHQGLRANIERCRKNNAMDEMIPDEYKPRMFTHGVEVQLPHAL